MYDLRRTDELIRGEEFANIIGRAGRARIDIEGQVLYVVYEPTQWRLQEWAKLVNAARHRQIQSGLATLIQLLFRKIAAALKIDHSEFSEYVSNNTSVWDDAVSAETLNDADSARDLEEQIGSLDAAILALIEDHDLETHALPAALDSILQDSLWIRTLSRESESVRQIQKAVLQNRARFIWENSTGVQRRGYFAAGVSLRTGKLLDTAAEDLNAALFTAESALEAGAADEAIASVQVFAERVFTIPPFVPQELPTAWKEVLAMWLRGEPMTAIAPLAPERAVEFIEDDIVYRLVWATEAVRVRSVMHKDEYAEVWTGRVAEALEAGTTVRAAAILLQAGLGSRAAALTALADVPGSFENYEEMRDWLRSPEVKFASEQPDWPTPDTSALWLSFLNSMSSEAVREWTRQSKSVDVIWAENTDQPPEGWLVRLVNRAGGLQTDRKRLVIRCRG